MSLFKKIEESIWTGKVIKDYGIIDEQRTGISRLRRSVLLTEKGNKRKVIIKQSAAAFICASVNYFEFDRMAVQRLKDALEDALQFM